MKTQVSFPDWWSRLDAPATLKARLAAAFTIHRDGYRRWYKGRARDVPKGTRPADVEAAWERKKAEIDGKSAPLLPTAAGGGRTFREILSEFLDAQEHRLRTGKPRPLSRRTLHNYDVTLNDFGVFVGGDTPFADTNRPEIFASYARRFGHYKASGYDSIVTRVGALYRWAEGMEYLDRYRPGPGFQRPAKSELRDQRIDLSKSFEPTEFAKLYLAAGPSMRCLVGLGAACAMNNAEVSNLARSCVDLDSAIVDFRRRKMGKARRVCPLPAGVCDDLRSYARPDPMHVADAGLFFLTAYGRPYSATRKGDGKPSDSLSRLFRELETAAGVAHKPGRNFSGLRTTWINLFNTMPRRGDYDLERRIIVGRAHGSVDLDSYLEDVGLDRLRHVSAHVWSILSTALADEAARRKTIAVGAVSSSGHPARPVG